MHAIGFGGWLGFFMMLMLNDSMLMSWPLSFAILITGLVCTSRMLLKAHPPFEIYLGLVIGIATQIAATYFV
jgi:membrane-associated phospholipid phosphatase